MMFVVGRRVLATSETKRRKERSMSRDIVSELVGAWRLVSYAAVAPNGETIYPMGPDARGRIVYDAGGRMAVQLGDPGRAAFASGDPRAASESEVRAAFDGYLAYFGTYTVDSGRGAVVHHLEMSLDPRWIGGDQVRYFDLQGDRLILRSPPMLVGGVERLLTVVWERLPPI
jgi:Lipocalin-like domain